MKLYEIQQNSNSDPKTKFFNFGSMRDLDIFEIVLGRNISRSDIKPAHITGYRAVNVKGEKFPALIKTNNDKDVVEGILVSNLTPKDVDRMEYYEEGLYKFHVLSVITQQAIVQAQVYDTVASDKLDLTDEDWNFDRYVKKYKAKYRTEVDDLMSRYK